MSAPLSPEPAAAEPPPSGLRARSHGFVVSLQGVVRLTEMQRLAFQLRDETAGMSGGFVMEVDAREFTAFAADAQALFEELLIEARDHGLRRLSVLAVSTALASQFCSIMLRTDLMPFYQFLDVAYETDWRSVLEDWLGTPFEEEGT